MAGENSFGGGGAGPIPMDKPGFLGPFPLTWGGNSGLGLAAAAPFGKPIPGLFKGTGKEGGLGDKFLKAMMAASDEIRQMAGQAGIMYDGPMPNGASVSPNIAASGGGMELG